MTAQRHDVIVVGGGHNGLIAATYLAGAGLDTLLLERRESVGLSLIHISEPTRLKTRSRMPSSA